MINIVAIWSLAASLLISYAIVLKSFGSSWHESIEGIAIRMFAVTIALALIYWWVYGFKISV